MADAPPILKTPAPSQTPAAPPAQPMPAAAKPVKKAAPPSKPKPKPAKRQPEQKHTWKIPDSTYSRAIKEWRISDSEHLSEVFERVLAFAAGG